MESHSLDEFCGYARDFAHALSPRGGATIVALSGDLGAGKTTFVQVCARELGVGETVSSPTFVIEKIYGLSNQKFARLIHIDAYRLKEARELEVLDWEEITQDPQNLIYIEWPERVPEAIPESAIRVRFDIDGDARIITIDDGKKDSTKGE